MSDRLQDLLRQRALIQEQLAWLDREIAAAADAALATTAPAVTPAPRPVSAPLQPGYLASQAAAIAAQTATAKAKAASARYTAERTRTARDQMGAAWSRADKAAHAMWDARQTLCDAAVADGSLDLGSVA